MVAHVIAIETSPLLANHKIHRSHRTLVLVLAVVAAIVYFVPLRPIPTNLNFAVTKPPRPFEPIAGAFAFPPSEYSHVSVAVERVTPDSTKTFLSAVLMVDTGSSDTSHVAFTISSSHELFQISSNVSGHIENRVLTITLRLNDQDSTAVTANAQKDPWIRVAARITLPQPTLDSFHFESNSPTIDASLSWETDTRVGTTFYASTASHSGGAITISPPTPLSPRLFHISTHKADIVSTTALLTQHLILSTHDGSIATDKLHASVRANVVCSGSGSIHAKVHATPELEVSTSHGGVQLKVDHVELGDKDHWTRVESVEGHVGVKLVGFAGAFVAGSEEGIVKVVDGGSRGEAAGGGGKVGWVGRKEGKGKVEVNSKKGNVHLTFLK
ncbi:hypothetical protein HDU98_011383 [Podochytrium sp. JEL0797]|nr:hypothetical protein HDU98_011383 [Podochytrium sp. JEL0797]